MTDAEIMAAIADRDRLRAEVERLKAANLALAERLAACSEVLGMAAERGKVCRCNLAAAETLDRMGCQ